MKAISSPLVDRCQSRPYVCVNGTDGDATADFPPRHPRRVTHRMHNADPEDHWLTTRSLRRLSALWTLYLPDYQTTSLLLHAALQLPESGGDVIRLHT